MEKPNILIVDDHDLTLLIQRKLWTKHYGVIPKTVKDCKEAISELRKKDYDLIILDLHIPEISGTDFLRYIRKNGLDIPIIMLTSDDNINAVKECITLGANDYIKKPIVADMYFKKIAKCIDIENMARKTRVI